MAYNEQGFVSVQEFEKLMLKHADPKSRETVELMERFREAKASNDPERISALEARISDNVTAMREKIAKLG